MREINVMEKVVRECFERIIGIQLDDDNITMEEIGFDSLRKIAFFLEIEDELGVEMDEKSTSKVNVTGTIRELIDSVAKMLEEMKCD